MNHTIELKAKQLLAEHGAEALQLRYDTALASTEVKAAQRREEIASNRLKYSITRNDNVLCRKLEIDRMNLESAAVCRSEAIKRVCEFSNREKENPVARIAMWERMRLMTGSSVRPLPLERAVIRMLPPEMFSIYLHPVTRVDPAVTTSSVLSLGVRYDYIKIVC
jgi:hypothetical protein